MRDLFLNDAGIESTLAARVLGDLRFIVVGEPVDDLPSCIICRSVAVAMGELLPPGTCSHMADGFLPVLHDTAMHFASPPWPPGNRKSMEDGRQLLLKTTLSELLLKRNCQCISM